MKDIDVYKEEPKNKITEEVNALMLLPSDELALPVSYQKDKDVVRNSLSTTYKNLSPELKETYDILTEDNGDWNAYQEFDPKAIRSTIKIAAEITRYLDAYVCDESIPPEKSELYLKRILDSSGVAFRMHPKTINSDRLQDIITERLIKGKPKDLSDILATDHYFGPKAIANGIGNDLVKKYTKNVKFELTSEMIHNSEAPLEYFIKDFYRLITWCKRNGLPSEATLRDGTPLPRFDPDTMREIKENIAFYPGFEISKANDGGYVTGILLWTPMGVGDGCMRPEDWLRLLTGLPKEINDYLGLTDRYNEVALEAASHKTIETATK